jgi:hypothetical protein
LLQSKLRLTLKLTGDDQFRWFPPEFTAGIVNSRGRHHILRPLPLPLQVDSPIGKTVRLKAVLLWRPVEILLSDRSSNSLVLMVFGNKRHTEKLGCQPSSHVSTED